MTVLVVSSRRVLRDEHKSFLDDRLEDLPSDSHLDPGTVDEIARDFREEFELDRVHNSAVAGHLRDEIRKRRRRRSLS